MPSIAELAEQLKDRIWFTRIARIHAEKRLLRNEFHSQLLLMVYSVYNIALAVMLLKYRPISDDAGSVLGIILSVTLLALSFQMSARRFSARAQRFKENYTRLQELLGRIELAECQSGPDIMRATIERVQEDYGEAIAKSENHTTLDDRCARFQYGKGSITRPLTRWEKTCVYGYFGGRFLGLGILYVLPLIIFGCMLFATFTGK